MNWDRKGCSSQLKLRLSSPLDYEPKFFQKGVPPPFVLARGCLDQLEADRQPTLLGHLKADRRTQDFVEHLARALYSTIASAIEE